MPFWIARQVGPQQEAPKVLQIAVQVARDQYVRGINGVDQPADSARRFAKQLGGPAKRAKAKVGVRHGGPTQGNLRRSPANSVSSSDKLGGARRRMVAISALAVSFFFS